MVHLVVLDPLSSDGWKPKTRVKGLVGATDAETEFRLQTADPRRSYEIPFESRTVDKWTALRDFHTLRGGTTFGFLLWDLFECFAQNQAIGVGDGATKAFQLSVTKSDAANSVVRTIRYPVPAGNLLPSNVAGVVGVLYGVALTSAVVSVTVGGSARTDFTVAPTTGLLSFSGTAPASGSPVVATFFYYTPIRFQNDTWDMTVNGVLGASTPPLIELLNE